MTSHINTDSHTLTYVYTAYHAKQTLFLLKREHTILVPGEGISQLLSVNVNVQSDGHQNFRKGSCLTQSSRVLVIIAERGTHKW